MTEADSGDPNTPIPVYPKIHKSKSLAVPREIRRYGPSRISPELALDGKPRTVTIGTVNSSGVECLRSGAAPERAVVSPTYVRLAASTG